MKNTIIKRYTKQFFIFFCLLSGSYAVLGQHGEHDEFHAHHTLSLVISHTQVGEGVGENGHKQFLSLPSWGLNYNYHFSPKWAIGLHNDIITEKFKVEEHGSSTLERSYPIASAVIASFKPGRHFSFMAGAGGEFAKAANYFLVRIGVEYSYEINRSWELNAEVAGDLKANAYNSFAIGLGVSRVF